MAIPKFFLREKRYLNRIDIAYLMMPLFLFPLWGEWAFAHAFKGYFEAYRHLFLISNILYIMLIRFIVLDSAIYIFSRSKHHVHITLIQVLFLYLEITVLTILYYATVYYIFDPFVFFHLNSQLSPENLKSMYEHRFVLSMYISAVTFTTLGSGDWIPQTLSAMIAVISEVILGVIQGGVFVAILIYAHQNREIK